MPHDLCQPAGPREPLPWQHTHDECGSVGPATKPSVKYQHGTEAGGWIYYLRCVRFPGPKPRLGRSPDLPRAPRTGGGSSSGSDTGVVFGAVSGRGGHLIRTRPRGRRKRTKRRRGRREEQEGKECGRISLELCDRFPFPSLLLWHLQNFLVSGREDAKGMDDDETLE